MQTQDSVPGDGRKLAHWAGPTYDELHRATLASISDAVFLIDEQGRFAHVGPDLRSELAHMARLALIGQLIASITHEVKQPLTAIVGNAAAAIEALGSDTPHAHAAELRDILRDIAAESRLAADVVDRLRALSRKRPLQVAPVDLNDVAAETVRFLASEARRRHIALSSELAAALPAVRADRVCIQQVLLGLALNAMEAMEETDAALRRLVLRTRRLDAGVGISVSDSGGGISEAALPNLFEAFYTTKSQGSGLGLAIARSLVETHGGRIWAENNCDVGATFHVALPAMT